MSVVQKSPANALESMKMRAIQRAEAYEGDVVRLNSQAAAAAEYAADYRGIAADYQKSIDRLAA